MTQRAINLLTWGSLVAAFSVGTAWATVEFRVSSMERKLDRIDSRVSAMYCAQVPEHLKSACQ